MPTTTSNNIFTGRIAVIALCRQGAMTGLRLVSGLGQHARLHLHQDLKPQSIPGQDDPQYFARVYDLTAEIFQQVRGLIYVLPCGVAVRAISGHLAHKKQDPAVLVIDVGGRWAVSLLSGHEGGANRLTMLASNILGAEPVISTTSEATRELVVGVGCRKGMKSDHIVDAIRSALRTVNREVKDVRLLATATVKQNEPGLLAAAECLRLPLRIIPDLEIVSCCRDFSRSEFVENAVGLPAVAEPAALLAGRRTKLLLPKTAFQGVTVAIAAEDCTW